MRVWFPILLATKPRRWRSSWITSSTAATPTRRSTLRSDVCRNGAASLCCTSALSLFVAILGSAVALAELGSPAAHAAPGEGVPVLTVDALAADSPASPAVSWATGTGVPGSVYVSDAEDANEQLFAVGPHGRQEAPWLRSGRRFEFRLYVRNGSRKLIATLEVEDGRAATRILARAGPPPRTPGAVNAALRYMPALGFVLVLGLLGWYVRELRT